MSDAPERIWVSFARQDRGRDPRDKGSTSYLGDANDVPDDADTQYVRADLYEAQVAEIERHKARIAELEAALQVAVKYHGHGLVNLDEARDALMKKEGE